MNTSKEQIRRSIFIFYFSMGICFSSWASRITDVKAFMKMNDAAWGTILLMLPLGQIIGMTLSGFLISKFGSRNILKTALPLYVFSLILVGYSQNEISLTASLILFGFFGNFCNIAVNTQGIILESVYKKSIMSSFHGGWSLAGFIGALIGLIMINFNLSPLIHFTIIAFLVLSVTLLFSKYLQKDSKTSSHSNVDNTLEPNKKKSKKPETFLYILGAVAFCGMASEGAMFDWSGVYFEKIVNAPKNLVPLGFASFMVMMASGRFISDKAIQKFGRQKVIQTSGLLISAGLFLSVIFPTIIVTTLAFMIIGLGVSSVIPTIYSIAGQKTKIATGLALTIVSSISFLGFVLGPPFIGYISEATNLKIAYALIGIFGILIFLFSSRLKVFKD